jgi:hypothetical protein
MGMKKLSSTVKAKSASPKPPKSTQRLPSKKKAGSRKGSKPPKALPPRKDLALERLGIDLDELDAAPKITETLVSCFGDRSKRIPRKSFANFLTCSTDPSAMAFMDCYRQLGVRDREQLPIEAICIKAGVNPLQILGAVIVAARSLKAQESALKAILAHPDVIDSTILTANLPGPAGTADRKMLHEAVGFLPTKQGSQIAINLGLPSGKKDDDGDDGDEKSFEDAFPTISGNLETWSENRRMLTEGK